jgi:type II secretory pathway pseudopilin PulG
MIAVLVLSIVAGLVASTVFVVIPWAQDHAAKNQLKSVMAAQQAYAGMAATDQAANPVGSISALKFNSVRAINGQTGEYGDLTDLIEADLFDPAFLPADAADETYGEQMLSPDKSVCIVKLEAGKGYEAAV